jgi:mannose-1-phosphate guanylyltransferase
VILAGDHSHQMSALIQGWLGENRPRQYCAFTGSKTMLEHTLSRALAVGDPEHLLTLIGSKHLSYIQESISATYPGILVEQPLPRGTAASVLVSSAYIMAANPEATVVIYPSDHFIVSPAAFFRHLRRGIAYIEENPEKFLLLGAQARRAETDYGWIESQDQNGKIHTIERLRNPVKVERFYEKPDQREAEWLYRRGCLWNTMILVVRVRKLWQLGLRSFPYLLAKLENFRHLLCGVRKQQQSAVQEKEALFDLYKAFPQADFSKMVLQRNLENVHVLPMREVYWSDWGKPERIVETAMHHNLQLSFPIHVVKRSLTA